MLRPYLYLVLFLVGLPGYIVGQNMSVGSGFGFTSYVGELNEGRFISYVNNWEPIVSAELSVSYQKYFSGSLQLYRGKLYGDDKLSSLEWMNKRNLSFHTSISGLALKVEMQSTDVTEIVNSKVAVYAVAGLEGFYFNPTTRLWGETYNLRDLGTGGQGIEGYNEKYSLWSYGILGGLGLKIRLTSEVFLKMELAYHKTYTDYLDDVGGDPLLDYEVLLEHNGEVAAALSDRSWEYFAIDPGENKFSSNRGSTGSKDGFVAGIISFHYILQ